MKYFIRFRGFAPYLLPEDEIPDWEFRVKEASEAYHKYKKDMPFREKAGLSRAIYELAETAIDELFDQYKLHDGVFVEAESLKLVKKEEKDG